MAVVVTTVLSLGGLGLMNGEPPAEVQPHDTGVSLIDGLPAWFVPSDEDAPPEQLADSGSTPVWTPERHEWGAAVEEWRPLVAGHFDPDDVETAMCLMSYESGGNPDAKNPNSTASGLFQLLAIWHDYFGIDPFIPEQNVYAAARLKALYGWSQWSPYNRGLCRGL